MTGEAETMSAISKRLKCRVVRGLFALTLLSGLPAEGQVPGSASVPDLGGLWEGGARDIGATLERDGRTIPFTPYGADRYGAVDLALNPNGYCLPPGPSRAITGPSPFLIVQSPGVVVLLHENHGVYRPIYIDGEHPADILDYPQFMGHSVGTWDGDTLVVDTIAINERTWLDSYGLEHGLGLRLTERFRRTSPDTLEYVVTYEDPEFYVEPWSLTLELDRLEGGRLIEYVCSENERDRVRLQSTPGR
jgi:hypothetical protein